MLLIVSLSSMAVKYLLSARFVYWIMATCILAVWPRHSACSLMMARKCGLNDAKSIL
jgi:hypothetical protein